MFEQLKKRQRIEKEKFVFAFASIGLEDFLSKELHQIIRSLYSI